MEELTFADDFLFGELMSQKEICSGVIERLLGIKVKEITYPQSLLRYISTVDASSAFTDHLEELAQEIKLRNKFRRQYIMGASKNFSF